MLNKEKQAQTYLDLYNKIMENSKMTQYKGIILILTELYTGIHQSTKKHGLNFQDDLEEHLFQMKRC